MWLTTGELYWGIIGFVFSAMDFVAKLLKILFYSIVCLISIMLLLYAINHMFPDADTMFKTLLAATIASLGLLAASYAKATRDTLSIGLDMDKGV